MLTQLIIHFSYPGVFLILLATGLGVPIPEELPIVIAAMMARWEVMHWWGALLSCLGGVLAGDMLLYTLGRHFGRRILQWPAARRILSTGRAGGAHRCRFPCDGTGYPPRRGTSDRKSVV